MERLRVITERVDLARVATETVERAEAMEVWGTGEDEGREDRCVRMITGPATGR